MKRTSIIALLGMILAAGAVPSSWASYSYHDAVDESGQALELKALKANPQKNADGTVLLNNKICPVSGQPATPDITANYSGVHYNLSDKRAYVRFRRNPAKYSLSDNDLKRL